MAPHSKKEIAAHFGYKDVKSFGERYIQPLLTDGRLALTIPDKPTSRNQQYRTVTLGKVDKTLTRSKQEHAIPVDEEEP